MQILFLEIQDYQNRRSYICKSRHLFVKKNFSYLYVERKRENEKRGEKRK